MHISIILLIVLIVVIYFFISKYNSLTHLKALLDEAWSGIDIQLKRRYDLIPNLVETVKGYMTHEKSVLENVTKLRTTAINSSNLESKLEAESGLSQSLKTLFAVAENYPELKANENFLMLQKDLSSIEHDLQLARRYYNGAARNYNVKVQSFPTNIIAYISGFKKALYFEVSTTQERENPKVNF